jgi:hypothetical protein
LKAFERGPSGKEVSARRKRAITQFTRHFVNQPRTCGKHREDYGAERTGRH